MMSILHTLVFVSLAALPPESRQATGVKVGEITPDSAIVWMRLTARAERNQTGPLFNDRPPKPLPADVKVADLMAECPGAPGRVRVRFGEREDLTDARATDWADVTAATDFAHRFRLSGLKPATTYHYAAETAGPGGEPNHAPLRGRFTTAPPPDRPAEVTFTVVTGMMYRDLDDPRGFHIYESMGRLDPDFLVLTGDTVYYDGEGPLPTTPAVARYHWHRMYGLPRLIEFHLRFPAYWEKDDHDTYYNDCWPGMDLEQMRPMTFEQGQRIFLEQAPVGDKPYRTFRWGTDVQVWLTEGRDFRSPNTMPDGPDKTIWGAEQKQWLEETILASDAPWKIVVTPTPIVGPDRTNKRDNHANKAFAHEGNEIRRWIKEHGLTQRLLIACGDRHWQYHSVDPATGVQEFSCGPASDEHAGGSPGHDPAYHKFHRQKGGFLSVSVSRPPGGGEIRLAMRFHDVHGQVVYEYTDRTSAK